MSEDGIAITPAGAGEMDLVRVLFLEYQAWLGVDLCFQGFDEELAGLPGAYAPPGGGIWIARAGDADPTVAGIVALRPQAQYRAEMKRLWLRPDFRGRGLGRRLAETAIAAARQAGYRRLCLDTLGQMDAARNLYADLGFQEIPAYYDNPLDDVRYLELDLRPVAAP
jgi:ribosomal protein S18 acetylase RimI-like enzyme